MGVKVMGFNLEEEQKVIDKIKNGVLRKFPLLGATMSILTFEPKESILTAETDGKRVFESPKFINSLTDDEKVSVFSHEIMHCAFDHIMRSKDKDLECWNMATDAVINQMLKDAGLPIPKGGIEMPEAKGKSAEEVYDMLKQNKESLEHNNQQEENQESIFTKNQGNHYIWIEAVKKAEEEQMKNQGQQAEANQINNPNIEKDFTKANIDLKQQIGEQVRKVLQEHKEMYASQSTTLGDGDIGHAPSVVSWKKILKIELEKEEDCWSYRRANEDNDFQARIGTFDEVNKPIIEVMLDTSGSIDKEMLINFLLQVKNLAKHSKLFVGCFDTRFYGFTEIKKSKDIDSFKIKGRGGTSFDAALASFSKDNKVNKIVFTDGRDDVSETPSNQKIKKLYWIVWQRKDFSPCCGKVINVDKDEFTKLIIKEPKSNNYELNM